MALRATAYGERKRSDDGRRGPRVCSPTCAFRSEMEATTWSSDCWEEKGMTAAAVAGSPALFMEDGEGGGRRRGGG
jgi:hypothetical protein